jgi:mannosyltransferase
MLLAFGLRAAQLGAQSLWFDEGWSWTLARMPLGEMAATTAGDRSPALYYGLLHLWIRLAGDGEFGLRFLSLLADVAAAAGVIALAARLAGGGRRYAAVVAGGLYAVCAFAVWYGQEARMYALVAALCAWSSYFLLRWSDQPDWKTAALSASLLAVAAHCHYYAIFLLPGHAAIVVVAVARMEPSRRVAVARTWGVATAAALMTVFAWLLYARGGFAYDDGFAFPLNTIDGRLREFMLMLAGGVIGQEARGLSDGWPVLLAVAFGGALLSLALRKRRREIFFALCVIAGPLLAATVAVRLVYPERSVFHPRYLIYVVPAVAALLGAGLARGRKGAGPLALFSGFAAVACVLALWLPALSAIQGDPRVARDDTRGAARHVIEALEAQDVVVAIRDNFALRYYWERLGGKPAQLLAAPIGLHGVLRDERPTLETLTALGVERVRLFLWQDGVVDPEKRVETALEINGFQLGELSFGQIRLPLYRVTQRPLLPIDAVATPVGARFGPNLELVSAWSRRGAVAGDLFHAALIWRALDRLSSDDKVFVHIVDAGGTVAFQRDKLPLNELQPMTRWGVGELRRDPYTALVPANLPPGSYRVMIGVYDPITGARRPATLAGVRVADDAVTIATVQISRRP